MQIVEAELAGAVRRPRMLPGFLKQVRSLDDPKSYTEFGFYIHNLQNNGPPHTGQLMDPANFYFL